MNVAPLFASHLIETSLEEDTEELKNDRSYRSASRDNRFEIQKDNIRVLEKYPRIKMGLLNTWKECAKNFFKYSDDFIISTSWITKTYSGDNSQFHHHKNSFYSGVYFFGEYGEDAGHLKFTNPLLKFPDFLLVPSEYNIHNSDSWSIKPETNKLVFFPSYLSHSIAEHKSHKARYSLAFNIVPTGKYGGGDSTYNTSWT